MPSERVRGGPYSRGLRNDQLPPTRPFQPDEPGLFTMGQVAEAGLRRNDPAAHAQQVRDGDIAGVPDHRPAVISVNMLGSRSLWTNFLPGFIPFAKNPTAAMPP